MTIRRSIWALFLVVGLGFTPSAAMAQTFDSENASDARPPVESEIQQERDIANPDVDSLLDQALRYAENGEWELALDFLDEAEIIDPDDPRIASYRASVKDLQAVDEAQSSWVDGKSVDVKQEELPDQTEQDETSPRFVIDRGDDGDRTAPDHYRDLFRIDFALKFFALDPIVNDSVNTWSSFNEFLYSSLDLDIRYWFPVLRRSFGLYFGSNGYSWRPGKPTILFNALDLGVNLRGFLLESPLSRMEIGIDFGASLHSENTVTSGQIQHSLGFSLGLWISDPVLYHVFNVELLENLVFGGGIWFYTAGGREEFTETLNYRVEGAWRFGRGRAGIRLEWWEFAVSGSQRNILLFSLLGGFRY